MARYQTPQAIVEALAGIRFRTAPQPSWLNWNFDAAVMVLGAMAAALTLDSDLSTCDFRQEDYIIHGLVSNRECALLSEAGHVYIHSDLGFGRGRDVFWTLVSAFNIAGCAVYTQFLALDGNGRPICMEVRGTALHRAITDALSLLATYYNMAGLGANFGLALCTGVHDVLSVVGQSDEGGYMRDVFRSVKFRGCMGGIPHTLEPHYGMPVIMDNSIHSIVRIVDSIALLSAAAVSHCDPLVVVQGKVYPTFFFDKDSVDLETDEDRAQSSLRLGRRIAGASHAFCENYAKALCKIFGFGAGGGR